MRICIINFADGIFIKGQERLAQSLKDIDFKGDLLFWNKLPNNWPKHEDVPWGFKPYAFEETRNRGYDMALWMDAAGITIRSLDHLFKKISNDGIFLFSRYSSSVGEWSSDFALEELGISRDEAFHIPELSASFIGINFNHPLGKIFFEQWIENADKQLPFLGVRKPLTLADSMVNKDNILSKDPRVLGHRHDQTVASILAYKLGLPISKRYIFDIIGEARKGKIYADYIPVDTVIVHNRDIKTNNYALSITPTFNKTGVSKMLQIYRNYLYSMVRYTKDSIKWHLVIKRKYHTK